jgi:hypothetical protein
MATTDDTGTAQFHGVLTSVQKRLSQGFSVLANYTWSRCTNDGDFANNIGSTSQTYQNPNDRAADHAVCTHDRTHVANASVVADIPGFGPPRLQPIVTGWQLSTILRALSGSPINVVTGRDNALTGTDGQRPNLVGDPTLDNPTILQWFNTSAFAPNVGGQFGNTPRNALRGPGDWTIDAGLVRRIGLPRAQQLELRVEAFNVLNRFRKGNPVASMASGDFGRIISAADPRIMQLALKYVF